MGTYILKRILLCFPMLLGISFISFCVMQMAPGESGAGAAAEGGQSAKMSRQQREILKRTFHLGKPLVERYLYWLGVMQEPPTQEEKDEAAAEGHPVHWHGVLFGDFGTSMEVQTKKVSELVAQALPITLLFNFLSLIIIYALSIPMGVYSATHQNTRIDRVSSVSLFAIHSLPNFWLSVVLIKLMVSLPIWLRLPFQGLHSDNAEELTTLSYLWDTTLHLILPLIVFTYASFAVLSRYMRAGMIDVIRSDYIRTARAKGLPEHVVIYKHALRNSLIPIITMLGSELPGLVSGSLIVEAIFGIPGMGYLGWKALMARDFTVLMADLTLVAVLVMAGFLISDLLYKVADPRIRVEE